MRLPLSNLFRSLSSSPSEKKYFLLRYDYNPVNLIERRSPHRPAHLALAEAYKEKGTLLLGGAFTNPIDGAALVFHGSEADVQEFIKNDPYVQNGIVTGFSYREWTVVAVGSAMK